MANSKSNSLPSPKESKKDLAATDSAKKINANGTSNSPTAPSNAAQDESRGKSKSSDKGAKASGMKDEGKQIKLAPHMREYELLNDREFKAHLYQQLFELQPYFTTDSQVAVEVDQDSDTDEISLTLSTTWGENRVDVRGRGDDVYTALSDAKGNLLRQIEEWYGEAVDSRTRDAEIRAIHDGSMMIH